MTRPRLPYAAPRRLDPRAVLVFAFAAGGASVASLYLMRTAPWWVVLFGAAVPALFGGALVYVPRGLRLIGALGAGALLTTAGAVMIARVQFPSGSKLVETLLTGLVVALSVVVAVLLPSLFAVRAAKQPAHDTLERVFVVASVWTALVPGGLGLMNVVFYWITGESVGYGGLTWILHALALGFGAALAGATLARDQGRFRFLRAVRAGEAAGWDIAPRVAAPEGPAIPFLAMGGDEAALVAHADEGAPPFRSARVAVTAAWVAPDVAARVLRRRLVAAAVLMLVQGAAAAAFAGDWLAHRGPLTAVELAAGYYHTCARRADGRVLCWGSNSLEWVGIHEREVLYHPVEVVGLDDAIQIAAGSLFTCALRRSGEVACWGSILKDRSTLMRIEGLPPARTIAAAENLACALTREDEVYCWASGQRWDERYMELSARRVPVKVVGATDLVVGYRFGCVLGGSELACFDSPGAAPAFPSEEPVCARAARGPGEASYAPGSLAAGFLHSVCAATEGGLVHCWDRDSTDRRIRRPACDRVAVVPGPRDARKVALRYDDLCVLDRAGEVRCWREDGTGGEPLLGQVVDIVGSLDTACAVREDHTLWCWGDRNDDGALGDGTRHGRATPVQVRR